jgi:hypothetical protein
MGIWTGILVILAVTGCASIPHPSLHSRKATPDEEAVVTCLGYYLRACEVPRVDANGERTGGFRYECESLDQLDPLAAMLVCLMLDEMAAREEAIDNSLDDIIVRRLSEDHARMCDLCGILEEDSFLNADADVDLIEIEYPTDWPSARARQASVRIPVDEMLTWNRRWMPGRKRAFRVVSSRSDAVALPQASVAFEIELSPCLPKSTEGWIGPEFSLFRQRRRLRLAWQEDGAWHVVGDEREEK